MGGEGIVLTWDVIIKAGAVLGALTAIVMLFVKLVRWVDKQKAQGKELEELKRHHECDMQEHKEAEKARMQEVKEEQTILTYGILACLKGLSEMGCNGPVTEAIKRIEKHLNVKAHE